MSTISLKNQRIVIIGGSSGIGLATAKQAVEQGAAVIIAGRSQDKLENAQQLLGFDSVEIHSLDNQNEQDLKAFFEKIGAFDHLFTPGASYVRGPITSSLEVAHNCFNAKFWPQYNAVKHAIPFINPTGSIVLMSGAFSQRPLADGASYAACNGAIESLGKALAVELAPIRVNVISPEPFIPTLIGKAQNRKLETRLTTNIRISISLAGLAMPTKQHIQRFI